jgi:hypothetical protein
MNDVSGLRRAIAPAITLSGVNLSLGDGSVRVQVL